MRGFFLRKSELNPVTQDYDYLATAPLAGDKVRVEGRIYNYSTAVETGSFKVRYNNIPAEIFRPLRLRLKVYSDRAHGSFSRVLVYEGDPDDCNQMIASKLVHSGNPAGSHAWFDWIPRGPGRQTLYAKLVNRFGDPVPGNNLDKMTIDVAAPDTTPPRLSLKLTPHRLRPADGRMVPVQATIRVTDGRDARPEVRNDLSGLSRLSRLSRSN